MVEIKLGRGFLLVGAIFAIGYLIIFITVAMDSGGAKQYAEMQAKLVLMQSALEHKYGTVAVQNALSNGIPGKLDHSNTYTQASRPGVIVLGMHRSGTSVVGGLITKMGLRTGGPLIPAAEDNEKGFFERVDVVIQNDMLLARQGINYALFTSRYSALDGLKLIMANRETGKFFAEGRRGLAFLNDKRNYPWMLKDPRLCITLRTWLPLLNFVPAILFIYRHPFDVSLSMNKRATEHFRIERAMKLWYVYNKRAIQQSDDLCLVVGSHKKIMKSPHTEFKRIHDDLNACGVDVPRALTSRDIESFIDIRLQHGKNGLVDVSCGMDHRKLELPAAWKTKKPEHLKLYRESMRVFCAMEDGSAFRNGFKWDENIQDE